MFKNDYSGPDYNFQGNNNHDYILRIIEQFAAYLWAIVFNKKAQNYDVAMEKIEETYTELLNKKGNDIKYLSIVEIIKNNTYGNVLEKEIIEIIANLIYEEAEINELKNEQNNVSLEYYCKSFELFFLLMNEIDTQKYRKNINEIILKLEYYELDNKIIFEIYKYYSKIGLFGKAEDKLYQLLDNNNEIIEEIINFYKMLLEKDDTVLINGNLPRNEIIDAMKKWNMPESVNFLTGKSRDLVDPENKFSSKTISNKEDFGNLYENHAFLTEQIITYIGNKRSLLDFITKGIQIVQKRLGKEKLDIFDVFTGSGIVARHCKQFSHSLLVNDLEQYAAITGECYLSNKDELDMPVLKDIFNGLLAKMEKNPFEEGIITKLYSPKDDNNIKKDERVFYTRRNAMYIDTMRNYIESVPSRYQKYFLAPLIAEASIHANTSGVFKGFHKNKETGLGKFGGSNSDALFRIKGNINLPFPVFSNFNCNYTIYNGDSNQIVKEVPEIDLAYLDPPYNQHPYGSNYFMLNLILENKYPENISDVSGIPIDWNRSSYNKKQYAYSALSELVENIKARYVLISFNSDGFISLDDMKAMLNKMGKVQVLETSYNTFRGCRNLANLAEKGDRDIHVIEYLYLLEK